MNNTNMDEWMLRERPQQLQRYNTLKQKVKIQHTRIHKRKRKKQTASQFKSVQYKIYNMRYTK